MNVHKQYEIFDTKFEKLIHPDAKLQKISSGHTWTEGPVWIHDQNVLLFSDIPNQLIHRWTPGGSVTEFRSPSYFANGNTRDLQGRLITCQHGTRSVTRTEHDGSISTLCDRYDGKRLNSPNDVVVKSDGSIWFTDPSYGILSNHEGHESKSEQAGHFVFRLDVMSGNPLPVALDFVQPNGLAFSPDEKYLYIAESGRSHDAAVPTVVRIFDVVGDSLENDRVFAEINPGIPDGLRVDIRGNVWISAADGVHCYDDGGKLLGKILVPETASNLVFGGPLLNQIFVTASSSVYSIMLNTTAPNVYS